MAAPLEALYEALHDLAVWEGHRIDFNRDADLTGRCLPLRDGQLADWQRRLILLEGAAALVHALAAHETALRALDPAIGRLLDAIAPMPTLWTSEPPLPEAAWPLTAG